MMFYTAADIFRDTYIHLNGMHAYFKDSFTETIVRIQ